MKYDGNKIFFNIFDTMKHPFDNLSFFFFYFMIDMIDPTFFYDIFEIEHRKKIELYKDKFLSRKSFSIGEKVQYSSYLELFLGKLSSRLI